MEVEAAKHGQSVASYVVGACWAQLERHGSDLVERAPLAQGEGTGGSIPSTSAKLDMEALRSICAGKLHPDDSLGRLGTAGHGSGLADVEPVELCAHLEWAPDGEQYRCRMVAGHKGKCQPGERVSA